MGEAEWLVGEDPGELIDGLDDPRRISWRRFRLAACACARLAWHLTPDAGRSVVDLTERYADRRATAREVEAAADAAEELLRAHPDSKRSRLEEGPSPDPRFYALLAAIRCGMTRSHRGHGWQGGILYVVSSVPDALRAEAAASRGGDPDAAAVRAAGLQCQLIRDVLANPFRPASAGVRWRGPADATLRALADGIAADRAFDRLPVLADALEGAGCTNRAVLDHCRGTAAHAHGCWVVDGARRGQPAE